METIIVLQIVHGIALTIYKLREIELIQKWKEGSLPFDLLLACKKHKLIGVRRLNPKINIGKHPGFLKKDN